ncbi:MAG: hypothetical protein ACT4P6_11785 [Gemmatimonadaceae bacterium]
MPTKKAGLVREPVQVYLDRHDRDLLETLAQHSTLSRAELLRLGLRRLSEDILGQVRPGASTDVLIGAMDASLTVPTDLAARHDDYLYGGASEKKPRDGEEK